MSTYEDDHNIANSNRQSPQPQPRSRQHQSLSSIIQSFLTQENTGVVSEVPSEEIVSNALRMLNEENGSEVVEQLLSQIDTENLDLPHSKKIKGVEQEFIDALPRVDLKKLKPDADCPICTNKFVDNKYPLIVKLPCLHTKVDHIFDLECIGPWLKFNSTCPLCRFDVLEADKFRREKLAAELKRLEEEDEEEEDDDWQNYG
ncbi:hypothetical protein DFJ63DRAFT_344043 [Scheffersomyces coipomensis]|uniref:uncharacterized protein n=1 Tax=Scheffersomyces coipomensis TaxID=1788519 RepID=UPI00315D28B9